jgi:ribosomal-protein-alanine N-acetyltransferase
MGNAGMNPGIVLEFTGGYLRPLKVEDVHPGYVAGLNNPEVNRYLDGVNRIVQTVQSVTEFLQHNLQDNSAVLLGIWQAGAKHHCGTVRLYGIEHHHKTAHIGICLFDKTAWGKKLGSKAIKVVTRWAFEAMGLRWIEAGAYQENIASQKTFQAAGYEWVYDIPDKYLLEGKPARVKVYTARNLCI